MSSFYTQLLALHVLMSLLIVFRCDGLVRKALRQSREWGWKEASNVGLLSIPNTALIYGTALGLLLLLSPDELNRVHEPHLGEFAGLILVGTVWSCIPGVPVGVAVGLACWIGGDKGARAAVALSLLSLFIGYANLVRLV